MGSTVLDQCGNPDERISIFRFDSQYNLDGWLSSLTRKKLIDEGRDYLEREAKISSYTGLEYWFDRDIDSRFKMSIFTFIGLLPLVLTIPPVFIKLINLNHYLVNSLSTAFIVLIMSYLMMPFIMFLRKFLFN